MQAAGALAAVLFHTATWLMTGLTFGIFYAVLVLSLPVFARWPSRARVVYDASRPALRVWRSIALRLDADERFAWQPGGASCPAVALETGRGRATGAVAVALWALSSPALYLLAAVALALPALWRYAWPAA